MALKIEFNAEEILAQFTQFKEQAQKSIEEAFEKMVYDTYANVVSDASKLSSAVNHIYMEALKEPYEVAPHVWIITLDAKAFWIEEGIEANKDMKPDLLKGASHRVIPFRYDRPPSQNTPLTQALVAEIKQKMKKEGISLSKIETDSKGGPRTGKLHTFDFSGKGRHVSWLKRTKDETHALTRINVYQSQDQATGKTRRDTMIFRTVTNGPKSAGKWIHPGYEAKKLMDKAMDKSLKEWEDKILPEIIEKWGNK